MRLLKRLTIGIAFAVGGILFLGMFSTEHPIPLRGGGAIKVKTASFWGSWLWSSCDIKYQPVDGPSGTISLTESWTDYPVLIIPKDDGKVLLCLFQLEDMCCQLVRFDTTKHFESLPLRGHLDEIIRNSPWPAETGNLEDFEFLCDFVKRTPANELQANVIPFPGFGVSRSLENRFAVRKSDLLFELNGVAANWGSLHQ